MPHFRRLLANLFAAASLLLCLGAIAELPLSYYRVSGPIVRLNDRWLFSIVSQCGFAQLDLTHHSTQPRFLIKTLWLIAQPGLHPQQSSLTPTLFPDAYHTAWGSDGWQLTEPLWLLVLLTSLAPILRLAKILRPRRTSPTQCQTCGYDLRATPHRCPECGSTAPFGNPLVKPL